MSERKILQLQLKNFLSPSLLNEKETQPTLHQHYVDHFNCVDRMGALLGHIPYHKKVYSVWLVILINLIRVSAVNTYTKFEVYKTYRDDEWEKESLKQCIRKIILYL